MKNIKRIYDQNPLKFILEVYAVYLVWFFAMEKIPNRNYHIVYSKLDDYIPFYKPAILMYSSWFLMLVIPFVYLLKRKSYDNMYNIIIPMFLAMYISLIIYVIYPTALDIRVTDITGNDICSWIIRKIQGIDAPNNVCPSIHVSTTVIIYNQFRKILKDNKKSKAFFLLWSVGICISTMLVKQHSIIDVVCGIILAHAILFVFNKKQNTANH
ncbi:MAG: phosphatase PAP2 family protein [Finegoldia magna]|uniref:phosphatase PAP2 family protein n=1 Tax=Finegoldia magna TaxID=1260 RepID=UPI00280635D2|nr:phosphatase PAP2 family protein [Finegoldia magna]MDU1399809.1 phosphatase PAP2 family protein [Finegoldia magna]MDU2898144.1 phosphatase PAP2 family protein [Finegoldia magna]MDU5369139.1 phosphatase PAP2 family protein [Finegoldia magna]MDU5443376.1 phosphatase PAP2 family protein [Finegoldia magna]MDU5977599.1 phosphatase PAP2 family protein [Finegoldia magna]